MSELRAEDFPALFKAADTASLGAQRKYTRLIASSLLFLVLGAALAAMRNAFFGSTTPVLSAVVLCLSLLLTISVKSYKFEQVW
jgi:hypothetical protein